MPFVSWLLVANETSSKWDVVKTITIMNHWTTPISSVALASLVLSLGAFAQNRVTSESNYIRTQGDFSETGRLYALLPQAPSQVKAQQDAQTKAEQEKKVEEKEQSERTLGVVPRFGTTDRMDAPPLKTSQKFRLFAKTAFDPVIVVIAAAQAGVSQADNQFKQYGQGAEGYGKRFGAAYADQVSSGFFRNFLYPTIFKQDPRYFRLGHGGFVHRFGYSLAQGVVCHTDSGGRAFNISNVLGAFTSGGLSNVYYPSNDRGFALTMSRSALAVAYAAGGNLLSEFWPDIRRKRPKNK
ncbi:MAG TPA: hypothetical protein VFA40_21700 [Terriglobales bacterium]|jgi:hypothetical protein|nr:hypothetical protein [Terriglobales bacterium]